MDTEEIIELVKELGHAPAGVKMEDARHQGDSNGDAATDFDEFVKWYFSAKDEKDSDKEPKDVGNEDHLIAKSIPDSKRPTKPPILPILENPGWP